MCRCSGRLAFLFLLLLFLLPTAAFAQAAITGVVRDTSGAVLPGVTVEAASPALIEKVRSVISDATGQYRIVDLRPGIYTVTFQLPGFSTVRRESLELRTDFVATVNADMKVGELQETVTVTGESPTVDVQSARVQTIMDRDVIAAIPSSRGATGLQSLVPGMSSNGDSGGINGGSGGMAGFIHGARASDSRTLHDGINTGWAGANSNAAVSNVAGSQEVVLTTSGGLGEAETGGVTLNVIPRDGGNNFSGTFFTSGASGAMQGSNYTQALRDAGLRSPQELKKVWEVNPMGGGRIIRDKLWFYATYREVVAENTIPGMFFNKNAGDPTKWLYEPDLSRPSFSDSLTRNAIGRLTWQISPRNKISLNHSEQYDTQNRQGGGSATRTPEAQGLRPTRPATSRRPPGRRPSPAACSSRLAGATTCRATPIWRRASTARTTISSSRSSSSAPPAARTTVVFLASSTASTSRSRRDSSAIRSARWRRCGRRHRTCPARTT
jgi:hypothetical protein